MVRWTKIGVIAGSGALPVRIAAACRARGHAFHVIRLAGLADASLDGLPGDDCAIGEVGKILRLLKAGGCDAVVFAGHVKRPDFRSLKVDWRGAALLPKLIAAGAKGDGPILNVLVETVEAEGMLVIGAEEVTNDLAALAGALGAIAPTDENRTDIKKAAAVIAALGGFDIGQGAVVANGLVLAVEAAEGTDAMLERCATLNAPARREARAGVLVKRPKPGQELRIDLPVIGPETVRQVVAAGLAGIAVEAGVALIIDRDEVVALADKAGIFVYGFEAAEMRAQ